MIRGRQSFAQRELISRRSMGSDGKGTQINILGNILITQGKQIDRSKERVGDGSCL